MIVFNTQKLSSFSKEIQQAQMYIIINYLNKFLLENREYNKSNNKKKYISITIDEAHKLIDKDNPIALKFAYEMYKRIRKYDGWMRFITQNIGDFTKDPKIEKETSAIINNTQFFFIFGLLSHDIKALNNLLEANGGLTSIENNFLISNTSHSTIFMSGRYRSIIELFYTDEEKEIMGWKNN